MNNRLFPLLVAIITITCLVYNIIVVIAYSCATDFHYSVSSRYSFLALFSRAAANYFFRSQQTPIAIFLSIRRLLISLPSRFLFLAGLSSQLSPYKSFYRAKARRFQQIRLSYILPKLVLCQFAYAWLIVRVLWFYYLVITRILALISLASSLLAPLLTSKHLILAINLVFTILTIICYQLAMYSREMLARLYACSIHCVSQLLAQTLLSCYYKYREIIVCGVDWQRKTQRSGITTTKQSSKRSLIGAGKNRILSLNLPVYY